MGKHDAKRFDSKEKKINNKQQINIKNNRRKKNKFKYNKFIFIFFIIIIITFIFLLYKTHFYKSTPGQENNEEIIKSIPLSNILSENTNDSPFATKKFENTNLILSDLFLKYENNITVINFNISNNSLINQNIFNFTFSLLDENNNTIISYELSSEKIIEANTKKDFVLIATRDVSNASDFKISINK